MDSLILKGPPLSAPKIDKGFGEYFFEQAELWGNKNFQIDPENGYTETYLVTKQRSTRVAINLQKMGIKQKEIVLICCRNNPNDVVSALASLYLGCYVASVDPRQAVSDVKHVFGLVEPRVIFVEEESLPLIEKSLEGSHIDPEIIVIGNSDKYINMFNMEREAEEEESFKPIRQTGSDIIGILFSSGTTSAPKGIQISNSYVFDSAQAIIQTNHFKTGVIAHFASLYWASSWIWLGASIVTGSAKLLVSAITGERFLQLVEKLKVTFVFSTGGFTYDITNLPEDIVAKYDTSSIYSFCVAGSTMEPQQMLKIRKFLPHTLITLAYGSSEGNCMSCFDSFSPEVYEEKISSSGKSLPGVELKVIDQKTGKPLGPNEEGEIVVKSAYLMSGYYKFEKPDIFDKDGFFKTGDIGYYDDDQYIYIKDRIGEMFKYKSFFISPSEIEHTLLTHPAVTEAVVFGVPHPIDRNHPAACVVLKNGAHATVQDLLKFVNSKVTDHQTLKDGLMIVSSMPKTPTGKIQRRVVRDSFIQANVRN